MRFDLLIRDGILIDGLNSTPKRGDVGIVGGRIAAAGNLRNDTAPQVISARGKYVAPGFLDIHRHGDAAVFRPGFGKAELFQGLTTIINGNCGLSPAPLMPERRAAVEDYMRPITGPWEKDLPTRSMADYLRRLEELPLPLNVGTLAGAGSIRAGIVGYHSTHLSQIQEQAIGKALLSAVEEGALGVSLGLGYAPECFYTTQELIRVLQPLTGIHVPLTVHMREESDGVLRSMEEVIQVADALRIPVHISHLKAIGAKEPLRRTEEMLSLIHAARSRGLEISCDAYPYTAGSTQLLHIFPPEFLSGTTEERCAALRDPAARQRLRQRIETGRDFENIARLVGFKNIILSSIPTIKEKIYEGKSIAEAAVLRNQDPFDTLFDLMAGSRCGITMIDFITTDQAIATILKAPYANVISDSTYPTEGQLHPRVYGSFVRILEKFVRQDKVLPLEKAVAAMTSVPAQVLGLSQKGRLTPGADADLVVFALEDLHEQGTYQDPAQPARGMDTVLVGGIPVIRGGCLTGEKPGNVLRRIK